MQTPRKLGYRFFPSQAKRERNAKTFNHPLCMVLMFLAICPGDTKGKLNQTPNDVTAIVNHPVYLNCSTSKIPVEKNAILWRLYPQGLGAENRKYIYDGGNITADFKDRFFSIEINSSSGAFNLVLWQPQLRDAGRYECTDDLEHSGASAELTVLESKWNCESNVNPEEVIGPTECDEAITPDELKLSCSVACIGENFPEIEWRINGRSIIPLCVKNSTTLTCNATMKVSQQMEGSISICQKGTQHCSPAPNVKVLYAFANSTKREYYRYTEDEVACVANTSRQLPCSYQWYNDNMTEVSSHPALKPNNPGLYRCQAQCKIRNHNCVFWAMEISVSESGQNVMVIVFGTLIVGLVISVIILGICLKAKQPTKRVKGRKTGENLLSEEPPTELLEVMTNGSSKQNGSSPKRSDELSKQKDVSFDNQQNGSDHKSQGKSRRRGKSERSKTT